MVEFLLLRIYSFIITIIVLIFLYYIIRLKVGKYIKKSSKRIMHGSAGCSYTALDVIKKIKGDYDIFERSLMSDSLILLILGRRGSGKTALALRIAENISVKGKRKVYVMGVNSKLPSFINKTDEIGKVPSGSVVVVDEGGIILSSRSSMKGINKKVSEMMAVSRHKDITLLFISQNSGMIDLNVLRLTDGILFKEPGLLQKGFERSQIRKISEKAERIFKEAERDKRRLVYILSDHYEGLNEAELPSFWSEKISKSWK